MTEGLAYIVTPLVLLILGLVIGSAVESAHFRRLAMWESTLSGILLSNIQTITPTVELLLFSAARTHLVESVIRPALEKGDVVLCDRFVDSTTAYQGFGRQVDLEQVRLCNSLATQGVMPTVTFFIDVPYDEAQLRMQFHPTLGEPDRMERSGREFFDRVRNGYLAIAADEPSRFAIVDGVQARADIHAEVVREMMIRL